MTGPTAPVPAWVRKRDGRLVPFEADKISRALFAVTEDLGQPDAFLARELADGVVHFLAAEVESRVPTTAQVADMVVKVVRELGHPALARAFADHAHRRPPAPRRDVTADPPAPVPSPTTAVQAALRDYSRRYLFSRDLVAAHDDGLLTLTGLEAPLELAAVVAEPPTAGPLLERLLEARRLSEVVVLDAPEHDAEPPEAWARALAAARDAVGLRAVVNLNAAAPPWAEDRAGGPLFAAAPATAPMNSRTERADALLDALTGHGAAEGLRVDWHLGECDLAPEAADRLLRVTRRAAEAQEIAFVFDRPRRPVALAEGLGRGAHAVLLVVGLQLGRLAELARPNASPETFVQKLGSLARLALSAAVQKREFLRRWAPGRTSLARPFYLERAFLTAAPIGLDIAVRRLTGAGLHEGKGLELARQIVQRLRDVLRQEGPARLVEARLDGPVSFRPGDESDNGLSSARGDNPVPIKGQLRLAALLHGPASGGTATLTLPPEQGPTAEAIGEALRLAWGHHDIVRVRFARSVVAVRQRSLPSV